LTCRHFEKPGVLVTFVELIKSWCFGFGVNPFVVDSQVAFVIRDRPLIEKVAMVLILLDSILKVSMLLHINFLLILWLFFSS
jgi:hypothetical protein